MQVVFNYVNILSILLYFKRYGALDALEKLSLRPQTVQEMTEATGTHAELSKGQTRLSSQLTCAEAKYKLLKTVAGSEISAFSATKSKWDKFQLMMESFKLMMNEQMEVWLITRSPLLSTLQKKIFPTLSLIN